MKAENRKHKSKEQQKIQQTHEVNLNEHNANNRRLPCMVCREY